MQVPDCDGPGDIPMSPGLQVTNVSHHLALIPSHPGWPWHREKHAHKGNLGDQASSPSLLPSLCSQECFKFPLRLHAFPKSHIFLETGCPSFQLPFDPLCGSVPKRGCRSLDSTKGSSAFHKALRHPLQGFPLSSSQLSHFIKTLGLFSLTALCFPHF